MYVLHRMDNTAHFETTMIGVALRLPKDGVTPERAVTEFREVRYMVRIRHKLERERVGETHAR